MFNRADVQHRLVLSASLVLLHRHLAFFLGRLHQRAHLVLMEHIAFLCIHSPGTDCLGPPAVQC